MGAVAPGYRADLLVLDDLETVQVARSTLAGQLVAEDGQALFAAADMPQVPIQPSVTWMPLLSILASPPARDRRA